MLAAMLLAAPALGAQDLLIRNSGEETEVKVLEVSRDYVKYRKFSNPDGPVFTVPVAEIFMIRYEDGTKTVFGDGGYNTGSGISDMSTPETAQPVKLERVLRPTRMQIGAMVRPAGVSLFSIGSNYVDGVYYESSDGVRCITMTLSVTARHSVLFLITGYPMRSRKNGIWKLNCCIRSWAARRVPRYTIWIISPWMPV